MTCSACQKKPVYTTQSHTKLCKQHFLAYFEKKVFRTIRLHNLLQNDDIVVCALSGGKDSTTVTYLVNMILKQRRKKVTALLINEGIHGYRDSTLKDARKFCRQQGIVLKELSFKKLFGFTLDEFLQKHKNINPCSVCGVIRRYLMNRGARELGATVLVTGHNLDDEAQNILMNQFKGNMQFSAKLGPVSGALEHEKFVKKVKPLYFMPEKEVALYAYLKQFPVEFIECPNSHGTFRQYVGDLVNKLEQTYPGTKQSIINSFLSILPELKKQYHGKKIGSCTICGEAAAQQFCKVCELLEQEKIAAQKPSSTKY